MNIAFMLSKSLMLIENLEISSILLTSCFETCPSALETAKKMNYLQSCLIEVISLKKFAISMRSCFLSLLES